MPDTFGVDQLPVLPTNVEPLDVAVGAMLEFVQKLLNDDQAFALAWRTQGIDPAHPPIVKTYCDDPNDIELPIRADTFPALFGWREGGDTDWVAADYEIQKARCKLLWVLPITSAETQRLRAQLYDKFFKAVYNGLSRGRTPSWIVAGDTDPVAASQGSFLGTTMGWLQVPWVKSWRRVHVEASTTDGTPKGHFPAVEIVIEWLEKQTVDIDDPSRFAPTDTVVGVTATIQNPTTGVTQDEGFLAETPTVD